MYGAVPSCFNYFHLKNFIEHDLLLFSSTHVCRIWFECNVVFDEKSLPADQQRLLNICFVNGNVFSGMVMEQWYKSPLSVIADQEIISCSFSFRLSPILCLSIFKAII